MLYFALRRSNERVGYGFRLGKLLEFEQNAREIIP